MCQEQLLRHPQGPRLGDDANLRASVCEVAQSAFPRKQLLWDSAWGVGLVLS